MTKKYRIVVDSREAYDSQKMMLLPQIVDVTKDSDQGLIDVHRMMCTFENIGVKLAHNRAYNIRKELLKLLHTNQNNFLKKIKEEK